MSRKLTTEEFIQRARQVHGDKYDYSKTCYANSETKVVIICPIHGEFEQYPLNHLKGCGCKECGFNNSARKNRYVREIFITKAKEIHGDKYDYSKVEYKGSQNKVCIICLEHGEFWMAPSKHLQGQSCPKCVIGGKLTTEEFIERANKVHGNKYDYSKVDYKGSKTKVCIICPEHGEFWLAPHNHINGRGCQECGQNRRRNAKRMSCEEFIRCGKQVHGDKYDYSKVEYVNSKTKVCIKCNKCKHEFWQEPRIHLSGVGCPYCKFSKIEVLTEKVLAESQISFNAQHKIGTQFLDFYLPQYNIAVECQGKQHFNDSEFFGVNPQMRKTYFLMNISRDIRKHNICKEQGIKLLYYIPKEIFNEDIFTNELFEGIYSKDNVFTDLNELKEAVKLGDD